MGVVLLLVLELLSRGQERRTFFCNVQCLLKEVVGDDYPFLHVVLMTKKLYKSGSWRKGGPKQDLRPLMSSIVLSVFTDGDTTNVLMDDDNTTTTTTINSSVEKYFQSNQERCIKTVDLLYTVKFGSEFTHTLRSPVKRGSDLSTRTHLNLEVRVIRYIFTGVRFLVTVFGSTLYSLFFSFITILPIWERNTRSPVPSVFCN